MSEARRIPKSLHTITALANVAYELHQLVGSDLTDARRAVLAAAAVLGYPGKSPDPDGLIDRATDTLEARWGIV
jgi:hypothetical protein